jgi:hypothetical protein
LVLLGCAAEAVQDGGEALTMWASIDPPGVIGDRCPVAINPSLALYMTDEVGAVGRGLEVKKWICV